MRAATAASAPRARATSAAGTSAPSRAIARVRGSRRSGCSTPARRRGCRAGSARRGSARPSARSRSRARRPRDRASAAARPSSSTAPRCSLPSRARTPGGSAGRDRDPQAAAARARRPRRSRSPRRRPSRRGTAPRRRRGARAAPSTPRPCHTSRLGPSEMRSRWGLRPNSPQNAAGMRIEPPPSEPRRDADRARRPRRRPSRRSSRPACGPASHGLRVAPNASDSVNGQIVSSGTCVLPMTIAPASRSARTTSASRSARAAVRQRAPRGDLAGDVGVVLDRHRHAEQRPPIARPAARVGLVGLGQARGAASTTRNALSCGIDLPDALERRLDQLARRDLAGGHQARLLGGAGEAEVGGVHGAGED